MIAPTPWEQADECAGWWGPEPFTGKTRRLLAALLNQQFWCFGQDVRHAGGNLLLRHGFVRQPRPPDHPGNSAYTLTLRHGRAVVLWSFGLFYGDAVSGGLIVPRCAGPPRLAAGAAPPPDAGALRELPPGHPPIDVQNQQTTALLLGATCAWLTAYEEWVAAEAGSAHRRQCLATWPRACVPAAQVAGTWRALAALCAGRAEGTGGAP